MQTTKFRSLLEAANSIVDPRFTQKQSHGQLNENAGYQNLFEGCSQDEVNLVNSISEVLENVENQLNITLTEEEIQEATSFILETAQNEMIIEAVQNDVGFQLNEEEVNYVLNYIRG